MATIRVVNATPGDAEAILRLYAEYFENNISGERVRGLVEKHPSAKAVHDGRIVGFCYTEKFCPDILRIANIYVAAARRGFGDGRCILNHILHEARIRHFKGIIASNSDAYRTKQLKQDPSSFYSRNGFTVIASTSDTKVFYRALSSSEP